MAKNITLEDAEVQNLQTYLERVAVHADTGVGKRAASTFDTKIIRDDVLKLMQKIQLQTGIGLADVMPTRTSTDPPVQHCVCPDPVTSRRVPGFCQMCGLTIKK